MGIGWYASYLIMKRWFTYVSRQDVARPLLPALLVFAALLIIMAISWNTARQDVNIQKNNTMTENVKYVESNVQQRLSVYENTLRAANGLFLSSDFVNRNEWKSFVDSLKLPERYPGIRGLGYARVVSGSDKGAYVQELAADGIESARVHPDGDRATYAPVTYDVPTAGQAATDYTNPVLGFDMYSDSVRKAAMDKAASSGEPALSGLVTFMQTNLEPEELKGYILFMPNYKKDLPLSTAAERQSALQGFFYAPFTTNGVMNSLFNFKERSFGLTIRADSGGKDEVVFNSKKDPNQTYFPDFKEDMISLYGQKWAIAYTLKENSIPFSVRARPATVLFGGSIFAALLALIFYLLIQRRTRALTYLEEKKLEEAKDDLLSLASHQLRTPATAVKQYVSMVKDGFAGPVTKGQRDLLEMAYENNERQLTIVDDLLYVARIDAGKAKLRLEMVNVSRMLQSVINDHLLVLKDRKQTVAYKKPARPVMVEADPQYLRMIIENLMSNASKYSYEHTQIAISLKRTIKDVKISFTDKGVGIEEKDYGALFQKFSRIPNDLSRHIAGSGIGLYLAKQLSLLHGGDIEFTSTLGKGSTFTLTVPRDIRQQE